MEAHMTTYQLDAIALGQYDSQGQFRPWAQPGRDVFDQAFLGYPVVTQNAFWSFDLSGVHGTIVGLTLRTPEFEYRGSNSYWQTNEFYPPYTLDGSELVNFWTVSTSISALQTTSDLQSGVAIYNDLQSGFLIGQKTFLESDTAIAGINVDVINPTQYDVPLNATAVFLANAQKATGFS